MITAVMKESFREFIFSTNTDGSGKAASYIRALDMLGPILTVHYPVQCIDGSMWRKFSLPQIHTIYQWICDEMKKGGASAVLADFVSPSYWTKNFCSAAVRAYGEFLAVESFEDGVVRESMHEVSGSAAAKTAGSLIEESTQENLEKYLDFAKRDGETKIAAVKVRVNQDVFRKMVLANYCGKCCVTGLDVPEVLRASHISPWSEDKVNRLNPENGLCLSATYDAAFDQHLISFDEDYRLVVSREIREHYTSAAAKTHFLDIEGRRIALPGKFLPSQTLLAKHRASLAS